MELNFSRIKGDSRGYRIMLGVLGAILIIFLVSYMVSYLKGFQVWGISNAVPWGQLITFDIYFIGLSAGAIVVSSLSYIFKKDEYKPIGRIAVFMGLLLMIGAMVCVLADLGRPEKFWRLFMFFYLNNMTSLFAINGVLYSGYIALMLVYLWLVIEGKHKLALIIGTIDVLWAVLVHTFTGSIFGFISTREILTSSIKPFEFVAAALTSGTALLIVVAVLAFKYSKRNLEKKTIISLGRMLSLIIVVLLVMVFFDKLTHIYFPHRQGALFLFTGPYWWLFWVFQIGMGIVVPLIILFHPRAGKSVKGVVVAAVSVVIGVLGERAALVIPGMAQVQQLYPGNIEGVWGTPGVFPITFWESGVAVGVVALVTLLFVLGLKYLELLPAKEIVEEKAGEPAQEGGEVAEPLESAATSEG
ncbi:NrfD/PsrC family molybdoenzyme membrane anchor subunit [Chloroflexota bacterium]